MRISDWSSDVCSSDLEVAVRAERNDHSARVLVRRIDEGPEYGGDPEQTRNRDLEQSVFLEKVGRALQIAVKMPTWSRSEEHTSELQSLMRISYAVSCLKKKKTILLRRTCKTSEKTNIHMLLNINDHTRHHL